MINQYQLEVPKTLIELICAESLVRTSVNASNRGGYHSRPYHRSPLWFQQSADKISQLANAEIYNFWFNINDKGHSNAWHSHGQGFKFLGIWYLQVPENSGNLEIKIRDKIEVIVPYPSLFITHSCEFEHRVTENQSDQSRISVAFNFK